MPDISIKAELVVMLGEVLAGATNLSPPPTPKGRYALSKAAIALGKHPQLYQDQKKALLEKHAVLVDGKPSSKELAPGVLQFDMGKGFGNTTPEFDADLKELNDEEITLSGVRQITHAELGACPITAAQEAVLIRAGLLEDREPE